MRKKVLCILIAIMCYSTYCVAAQNTELTDLDLYDHRITITMPKDYELVIDDDNSYWILMGNEALCVVNLISVKNVADKYSVNDVASVYYHLDTLTMLSECRHPWYDAWHNQYEALYQKDTRVLHVLTRPVTLNHTVWYLVVQLLENRESDDDALWQQITSSIRCKASTFDQLVRPLGNNSCLIMLTILFVLVSLYSAGASVKMNRIVDHLAFGGCLLVLLLPICALILWPYGIWCVVVCNLIMAVLGMCMHIWREKLLSIF